MTKPETYGFQKRTDPSDFKDVRIARITYFGDTRAECSCGWSTGSIRKKVLDDKIDRHLRKRHGGRGIRL